MSRFLTAILAAASCVSIAQAQTAPPSQNSSTPFTLERALSAAGASSPSIEAADAGVRAASAARTIAGLRPNPEIQVQVENIGGTGQFKGTQSAETTGNLNLPIELGGKRSARIAVADSRSRRARIEAAIVEADLRERVTLGYVDAVAAELRLEITRQRADFANSSFKAASARVTAGAASPIEEQRAHVERVNADVALTQASRSVEVARSNLGLLIGTPVEGTLETTWFDRVGNYGPSELKSVDGTLTLAAAEADITTANAQVRLARSQRLPDLTLMAGARRLTASNDTAAVIGISIPFPVFNSGRAAVSQAEAESQQADARRRVAKIESERALAGALTDVANAEAMARAAGGPALQAATEAARIARIGYAQGKFSQLELIEAERTLSTTKATIVDSLEAYHDAQARLARLMTPAPDLGETER